MSNRIIWNGTSVEGPFESLRAAATHLHNQQEYSRRIGQSAAAFVIQEYIGDGEWSRVSDARIAKLKIGRG
jgi:hypothetical protein